MRLFIASFVLFSCTKLEVDTFTVEPINASVAVPIVNTDLTLENMVQIQQSSLNITTDNDGLITFSYFQELFSQSASDYITVPSESVSESQNIPALPGSFGTYTYTIEDTLVFTFTNGEEIEKIILKSGNLVVDANHTLLHDVSAVLTFPTVTSGGSAFTKTYPMTYASSVPTTVNETDDLTGYELDLTAGGTTVNKIPYSIEVTVTEVSPNIVAGTESINFDLTFQDPVYSYIEGYFGQFTIPFAADTVEVEIFDNYSGVLGGGPLADKVYIEDPQAYFSFENSMGMPVSLTIDTLVARDQKGVDVDITGSYKSEAFTLGYPTTAQAGETVTSGFSVTKSNSNIQDVFNPTPNRMIFDVSLATNQGAKETNFLTDSSKIKVSGETVIPMEGRIYGYALSDTITGLSLPDTTVEGYEYLEEATIRFKTENGFPLGCRLQGYFLDSNDVVVDSLFHTDDFFAYAAGVDGNGKVSGPTTSTIDVVMNKERYKQIMNSTKAIIIGYLQTTDEGNTPVKIYTDYFINVDLGVKIDGQADLNDL